MFESKISRRVATWRLAACLVFGVAMGTGVAEGGRSVTRPGQRRPDEAVRITKLTLRAVAPSAPADASQFILAPPATIEKDACPLYAKAAQLLPANLDAQRISDLLGKPLEELALADAESVLRQSDAAMAPLEQAAACKSCDWPRGDDESMRPSRDQWRQLTSLLGLEIHCQLARRQYAAAVETLRVGFATAHHLGHGPTVTYGLTGVTGGGHMCREIELFVQQPGAPSLLTALEGLPLPFIDLEAQIESEGGAPNERIRNRIVGLPRRINRHIAALRCIEALRMYATTHHGTFPETLSQVTGVIIPADPVNGKPFAYRRDRDKAFLEALASAGDEPGNQTRYELTFRH